MATKSNDITSSAPPTVAEILYNPVLSGCAAGGATIEATAAATAAQYEE